MDLGQRYGFHASYPLDVELTKLSEMVTRWMALPIGHPTPRQKQAAALRYADVLKELRYAEAQLVAVGGAHLVAGFTGLEDLEREARAAAASVPSVAVRGEAPDQVARWVVAHLWRIYRVGAGRDDIGGRFAEFVEEASTRAGYPVERSTVIRVGVRIRGK